MWGLHKLASEGGSYIFAKLAHFVILAQLCVGVSKNVNRQSQGASLAFVCVPCPRPVRC